MDSRRGGPRGGGGGGGDRGRGRGGDFRGGGRGGDHRGGGGQYRGGGGPSGGASSDYRGGGRGGGGSDFRGGGGGGRGDFRGGRGGGGNDFRGGRGGGSDFRGGRGGRSIIRFQIRAPKCSQDIPNTASQGWKDFKMDGDNLLPRRPKGGTQITNSIKMVNISVNHFEAKIKFPKKLYRYRIDLERKPREGTAPPQGGGPSKGAAASSKKRPPKPAGGGSQQGKGGGGLPKRLKEKIIYQFLLEETRRGFGREYGLISDFSETLYTCKRLEESGQPFEQEVRGVEDEDDDVFILKISHTTEEVDPGNLQSIINNMEGHEAPDSIMGAARVYSALMRCVHLSVYTPMRRADLVDLTKEPHPLGGGVVAFPGWQVLFPITNGWKKFINIEIANLTAFMNGSVYNLLDDIKLGQGRKFGRLDVANVRTWDRTDFAVEATKVLKTCQVRYEPTRGRVFSKRVDKVCGTSISQTFFEVDGRRVSVLDYFARQYGLRNLNRDGPCLECRGNLKPLIPAEICQVKKGQVMARKLDDNQVKEMATVARQRPEQLKKSICAAVPNLNLLNNDKFKTYGVEMQNDGRMHQIQTHVLTPPELCYGKRLNGNVPNERATIVPQDGVWDISGENFEFYSNTEVIGWGVLNLAAGGRFPVNEEAAWRFVDDLTRAARTRGIQLPKPIYDEMELDDRDHHGNVEALTQVFGDMKKKLASDKSFVLVFIPAKNSPLYPQVKQAAELKVGLLTSCIVGATVTNRNLNSIVMNVLIKLNSKLDKVNYVPLPPPDFPDCFKLFDNPVIIVGADVNHGPPGSRRFEKDAKGNMVEVGPPSYVAVTASICRTGMPYMMHVEGQRKIGKGAAEVITNLEAIMKKFLEFYKSRTKKVPVKIIYYRDGVGDSQFQEVLHVEMSAIRRACSALHSSYKPRITFITVGKRHKTRLFHDLGNDQVANAPPGTVVDRDIVHPTEIDFYLLSHQGLLGTSRPTRYHVLWDDSDFTLNEIQTMTYFLCYMFVRCCRSVKIPAPTYYSHWAAKRADVLTKGLRDEDYADLKSLNVYLEQRERNNFSRLYPMHFV